MCSSARRARPPATGAAYLFNGATGALIRTYAPPEPQAGERFGYALTAIAGGRIAVVAPKHIGSGTRGAVFALDAATGAQAYRQDVQPYFRNDHTAIAAAGDLFVYGNIQGYRPSPHYFTVKARICRASDGAVLAEPAANSNYPSVHAVRVRRQRYATRTGISPSGIPASMRFRS